MTSVNKRKLDAWIAVHIMGWKLCGPKKFPSASDGQIYYVVPHGIKRMWVDDYQSQDFFWHPTEEAAASRELEIVLARKLDDESSGGDCILIQPSGDPGQPMEWVASTFAAGKHVPPVKAETFDLAIALLAKQVFSS